MQIDWVTVLMHTTHYKASKWLLLHQKWSIEFRLPALSTVKIVRDLNAQPKIQPYTVSNEQLRQNYCELLSSRQLSKYILRIMGIRPAGHMHSTNSI